MFWAQAFFSFLAWVAYGVWLARRGSRVKDWAKNVAHSTRGLMAAGLFLGGAAIFFGIFAVVVGGKGIRPDGIVGWAHLLLTLGGLGLIHAQILAMALLVASAQSSVTNLPTASSASLETTGNLSDETPHS